MSGRTGLEPATSGVTGRRYNRLNYRPFLHCRKEFLFRSNSNAEAFEPSRRPSVRRRGREYAPTLGGRSRASASKIGKRCGECAMATTKIRLHRGQIVDFTERSSDPLLFCVLKTVRCTADRAQNSMQGLETSSRCREAAGRAKTIPFSNEIDTQWSVSQRFFGVRV